MQITLKTTSICTYTSLGLFSHMSSIYYGTTSSTSANNQPYDFACLFKKHLSFSQQQTHFHCYKIPTTHNIFNTADIYLFSLYPRTYIIPCSFLQKGNKL